MLLVSKVMWLDKFPPNENKNFEDIPDKRIKITFKVCPLLFHDLEIEQYDTFLWALFWVTRQWQLALILNKSTLVKP